jgi:hypothetical protein
MGYDCGELLDARLLDFSDPDPIIGLGKTDAAEARVKATQPRKFADEFETFARGAGLWWLSVDRQTGSVWVSARGAGGGHRRPVVISILDRAMPDVRAERETEQET